MRPSLVSAAKKLPNRLAALPAARYRNWSLGLVAGGVIFGWIAFPYILSFAISKMVTLNEGTDVRQAWIKLPQNLTFSIYVFNITNPVEFQNGDLPIVEEIGPYVYEEVKEKVDLVESVEDDTITYSNKATWYFMREKSHPLTGDELITIPHLPLFAVLLLAESGFPPPVLGVVNLALPTIYGRLRSVCMVAKASQLLFDGVEFDCSARSLLPRAVCVVVRLNSRSLQRVADNKYRFSIFGLKNGTAEPIRMTVKRGTEDVASIGRLVRLNGRTENTIWSGEECNRLVGTDSTVFPPFRRRDNYSVSAYAPELCRSLFAFYERDDTYKGIAGYRYNIELGDSADPSHQCYCLNPPRCHKKGTTDLLGCSGAPLVASLPHFYAAEESYRKGVVGLKPEKDKHEISILLEPTSGTPLVVRKRVQGNIDLHPIRFVNLTSRLRRTMVPIFWAEESFDLGEELRWMLEATLLRNVRAAAGVTWACIGAGAAVGLVGAAIRAGNGIRARARARATAPADNAEPDKNNNAEQRPDPTAPDDNVSREQRNYSNTADLNHEDRPPPTADRY